MGSIVNGIALHNGMLKPYGSTFLIFSDYMRPAVRLSALSRLQSLWVWTHDSVGLGEDGPTHQPVEHYAALRAIPFLWFVRPADATETVGAWKVALEREDGPVALALTRQKLPTLEGTRRDGVARGGYVLWESDDANGAPDLILIATGSEVHVALAAAKQLDEQGTHARVVSMPCWELFEAQPREYRDEVLPPDVKARLSVEAGVALGWRQWVGDEGDSISIEHFGASAPGPTVLEKLRLHAGQRRRPRARAAGARQLEKGREAMAESNLHKLSARGQSVWIDSLSRTMLETGELARLMKEDAVVGVTTNPTIFQKAISSGDAYDEQIRELLEQERIRRRSSCSSRRATSRRRSICSRRCTSGSRRTASSRGRSTRRSRTTVRAPSTRRCGCTSGSSGRTST